MKSKYIIIRPIYMVSFVLFTVIILISCNGCGSKKKISTVNKTESEIPKAQNKEAVLKDKAEINNRLSTEENNKIHLARSFVGKEVKFEIDTEHPGGEAWTVVWKEDVPDDNFERMNRIVQLSPTVILYRRFPTEVAKNFYYIDQPEKIEFLDTNFTTIKIVDIWKERPYQNVKNAKLTYNNFDSESMEVLSYKKQVKPIHPTEYSLFTEVRSEGNHVIVNYELRSLETIKSFGIANTFSKIIGIKHTLYIYDLKGNLKYKLIDLPSVDGAVISNNGKYMIYTFGGITLATTNNPFGTIEREGWALMRLQDQKILYLEYTDDGILAFNRLWMDNNYPKISYSTPSNKIDYDYWIYFDEKKELIYSHKLTKKEREQLRNQFIKTHKVDIQKQIIDLNFQQIPISNQN